jgi:hypothetical protein
MKYLAQITIALLLVLAINTSFLQKRSQSTCWQKTSSVGVGRPLSGCSGSYPVKSGLLCYQKCNPGYKLSWGRCKKGWFGHSYSPQSSILGCPSGTYNNNSLCYSKHCPNNTKQVGPLCWGRCPSGTSNCFGLCLNGKSCSGHLKSQIKNVFKLVKNALARKAQAAVINAAELSTSLMYPMCP